MKTFEFKLKQDETTEAYIRRVCLAKAAGTIDLTWAEIAQLVYKETGVHHTARTYSNRARRYSMIQMSSSDNVTAESENSEDTMNELIREFKIIRSQVADERTQNNAYIRRIARERTIVEIAKTVAEQMDAKKMLPSVTAVKMAPLKNKNEAILQLSDWHFGIEVNNYWNKFNPKICIDRVKTLRDEVIAFCQLFKVSCLHVVNLSDLIAGRIHATIRLESRCDTVSQILAVSELLAEFLTDIMNQGIEIKYYDCLDNHSRLEPVKADSLDLESLVRIIPWYLKERLANRNITIYENEYDDDIITFTALDGKYKVAAVHGHKDKPGKVVDNLSLLTKNHYDLILTAHLHHFSGDEKNETVVVSNGSLMGTDRYAKDLRLSATPSQNIILVNDFSVVDYIHRIVL